MAGTELGKAWVQIVPSADGISGSIQKILDPEAEAAGNSSGSKLVGSIKKMIVGAGLGAALKKTLEFGADLQQNLGGTEAVFGDYAASIQNTAQSAYKNMGLSASDYMATANKMGSLFQGSGVDQVRALELTQDAMQRAADVASVMGLDTSMAMESIAGAAKGNFTMMDNLGVAMNATTLEAYALEKGINFDWNTADNAEKAELAMKMFMDRTSQYAGNFARESEDTFSGSIGAMKAAMQDLMGNIMLGENVSESMSNLAETVVTFIGGNFIPAVGNILVGLPAAFATAFDTLVPTLTDGLRTASETVKAQFPQMLQGALQGLVTFSGNVREKAGEMIGAGLELIKSLAMGIIQSIPTIIETVPTIISNFSGVINDNAPKVIATGLSIIKALAVGLVKAIPVLLQNLPQILKAMWDMFTAFQWLNLGKTIMSKLGSGIKNAAASLKTAAKNVVEGVKSAISGGFTSAKEAALGVFESMKTGISDKLEAAKGVVSGIIEKIKGMFPFSIGKIFSFSLPKISIGSKSTSVGGKTATAPDFGVSFENYAKAVNTPYKFTKATVFDRVAGETADEMLYGHANLMRDIRTAVKEEKGGTGDIVLNLYYNASDDAAGMARQLVREVHRYKMAGAI